MPHSERGLPCALRAGPGVSTLKVQIIAQICLSTRGQEWAGTHILIKKQQQKPPTSSPGNMKPEDPHLPDLRKDLERGQVLISLTGSEREHSQSMSVNLI